MICKVCKKEIFGGARNDICWTCIKRINNPPPRLIEARKTFLLPDVVQIVNKFAIGQQFKGRDIVKRLVKRQMERRALNNHVQRALLSLCAWGYLAIERRSVIHYIVISKAEIRC